MNRKLTRCGAVFVLSCVVAIGYATAPVSADTSAPLLDRGVFVVEPDITDARLSPTGTLLAFLKPFHGVETLWVKRTDGPITATQPVIGASDKAVNAFYWSNDGRYLLFTTASSGNRAELFAVRTEDISASGNAPKARSLTARHHLPWFWL